MAKRSIRQNAWGNWNGYLGTKRAKAFGTDGLRAEDWVKEENCIACGEFYSGDYMVHVFEKHCGKEGGERLKRESIRLRHKREEENVRKLTPEERIKSGLKERTYAERLLDFNGAIADRMLSIEYYEKELKKAWKSYALVVAEKSEFIVSALEKQAEGRSR